ncbi:MAG TPA: nuclear transport factor 2 family protein [Chitinophagaceae bacterium]|nr:nuclear transport factor 2 family protein [Chitinophagaceae bacterium]
MKLFSLLALLGILFSAQLKAQTAVSMDIEPVKDEIKKSNALFGQAFAKGDSAAIVSLYHSEAKVYPPNMGLMGQRSEMGHFVTAIPGMGVKGITLNSTEVFGSGDLIIELGTYEMSDGTKAMDSGKYVVVWKKENGKYKMYRDMWNSNMPVAQQ